MRYRASARRASSKYSIAKTTAPKTRIMRSFPPGTLSEIELYQNERNSAAKNINLYNLMTELFLVPRRSFCDKLCAMLRFPACLLLSLALLAQQPPAPPTTTQIGSQQDHQK